MQIVKTDLGWRRVGDVFGVGRHAFIVTHTLNYRTDRKIETRKQDTHLLGVAGCQIIVGGNKVHPFTGECAQIDRLGCR